MRVSDIMAWCVKDYAHAYTHTHSRLDEPDTSILYLLVRWQLVMAGEITYGLIQVRLLTATEEVLSYLPVDYIQPHVV